MVYFVVQARCGSTRMPNKILLPFFEGKSILDLLIEKLKIVEEAKVIIATTVNSNCDAIENLAKKHDVICYRGSENDVLQRFIDAAEANQANQLIRVCSDNPFLDLDSIKKLIAIVDKPKSPFDYVSYNINGTPSIKTHYGFWTEFVTIDALKRVKILTNESIYHEHVTNYIYTHPEIFRIHWIDGGEVLKSHSDIRLTIDTQEDFKNAQQIYANFCKDNSNPTIEDIVSYLDNHKEYYKSMRSQIILNSK